MSFYDKSRHCSMSHRSKSMTNHTLCSDSIHYTRKGLLQSVAAELYNPPRHPPLTLITAEDLPQFSCARPCAHPTIRRSSLYYKSVNFVIGHSLCRRHMCTLENGQVSMSSLVLQTHTLCISGTTNDAVK